MPLIFPTSPTNGQTVTLSGTTYTYNATKGVWEATASGGGFVAGSFSENILPDTDNTYDIGSASYKIRDLYVSDNSLHIGDHTMSADSEGINIPALKLGTGSNRVKLTANAEGKLRQVRTVGGVAQAEEGLSSDAGTTAVDTFEELKAAPVVAGKTVLVRNTNKLYINTGTGWYVVGQVTNESPTAITGLDATYSLATDGTATVITMNSTDPEGFPLTWSHAVTTGTLGSTATITNTDNVFTITPSSTEADAGSFSVTFSASDGSQAATSVSEFTLQFGAAASSVLFTTTPHINNVSHVDGGQNTDSWTVPASVYSISAVVVGAGGGGGGSNLYGGAGGAGGGLAWKNNISVTPGEVLTIKTGKMSSGFLGGSDSSGNKRGANGGASEIFRGSTILIKASGGHGGASGGTGYVGGQATSGAQVVGDGGGSGGPGGQMHSDNGGGGGGAGGYSGNGGQGCNGDYAYLPYGGDAAAGAGGGGGGGYLQHDHAPYANRTKNYGGGVGLYGEGSSGLKGNPTNQSWPSATDLSGGAGSGASAGSAIDLTVGSDGVTYSNYSAGLYGGGGGTKDDNGGKAVGTGGYGGGGGVRILWGNGRSFPSTNVSNSYNVDAETTVQIIDRNLNDRQ